MTTTPERRLDPEAVCIRIVARLIEELGCVDIAPDSPAWQDLVGEGARVGELRVYRGRGRVQKVVSLHAKLEPAGVDAHTVVAFTSPDSPVPHFLLETLRSGEKVTFRVDLLPKRDLVTDLAYLERCYAQLFELKDELILEAGFVRGAPTLLQRALCSPCMALYTCEPDRIEAAALLIDRYFSHWSSLLKNAGADFQPASELSLRDRTHRKAVFSRAADPSWAQLDRALSAQTVELLVSVLSEI